MDAPGCGGGRFGFLLPREGAGVERRLTREGRWHMVLRKDKLRSEIPAEERYP